MDDFTEREDTIVHLHPVWQDRGNDVIRFRLEPDSTKRKWEEIWVKRISSQRFLVCAIPFFVYHVALGDEVETDEDQIFSRVVSSSGQSTFRVWIEGLDKDNRARLRSGLSALNVFAETYSENLFAISVSEGDQAQAVADFLASNERAGLLVYETGQ